MSRGIDGHNQTSFAAVLDLRVTERALAATQACTIASQGFAWHVSEPDPVVVIIAMCREFVTATDTDRR